MDFVEIVKKALELSASDIFIVAGQPVSCKVNDEIVRLQDERIMPDTSIRLIEQIYEAGGRPMSRLETMGDDDLAISLSGLARLRICTYKQRGSYAAVIRVISFGIPDYKKMNIPEEIIDVANVKKGLVLVTGTAGSGKSTTLACMIDAINKTRSGHIITLEDPIEFLYKNDHCIVSQREVELDTKDYITALRAAMRQAPDVILLGEMRDYETIKTAVTAAETGHLVLSTLHTLGAVNTIDRIIDIFPANQQQQIRIQLSMVLQSVISQQLVPTVDGFLTPVFEIMKVNNAVRNMIRETKVHQIESSGAGDLRTMDHNLLELYKKGQITEATALHYSLNIDVMNKRLSAIK